jgi:hypothetical protein
MDIFRPWQQTILQYADQRFRKTLADTLYYTTADYSVISLLQRMKTESGNAMLKKWLGVSGNGYHKQEIVLGLLKNNQEISRHFFFRIGKLGLYRNAVRSEECR